MEATTPPPPLYPIPCNSLTTLMSLIAQGRGQIFPFSNDLAGKQFTLQWKQEKQLDVAVEGDDSNTNIIAKVRMMT